MPSFTTSMNRYAFIESPHREILPVTSVGQKWYCGKSGIWEGVTLILVSDHSRSQPQFKNWYADVVNGSRCNLSEEELYRNFKLVQ